MNAFLESMLARAKADRQTIVLPEGDDERTLDAAEKILADDVADLVILGDAAAIRASGRALDGARVVDPRTSDLREELAGTLYELRQRKGMTPEQALALMDDVLYFGVMMVKTGRADGMVAGACHATGDVLRPSLQILKTAPGVALGEARSSSWSCPTATWGRKARSSFRTVGWRCSPTPKGSPTSP